MAESVWRIAGRYRVLDRIGSGGMADVVRAHDELLDRDVAVKVFRSVPPTPDTATGVERQQAELRALARLNHPNLTVLYDGSIVGQDGPAYLVMELIEGGSLAEAIESGGLGAEHTGEVGAQVADALAYVHAAGMVHRDVKPANILLGGDGIVDSDHGRARLTDFGIVRLIGDEPLTQADMTLGSASYLAPEQTRGSSVGPPADIYALGLSLLEALTGQRSFEGPPLEAALARLSNDPHIPANLPQPWPGLLAAMTARDPAARPTAARVAKALRGTDTTTSALSAIPPVPFPNDGSANATAYIPRAAAAAPPVGAPPLGPPPPVRAPRPPDGYGSGPERRRSVSPWLIAAIAVVVALLVIGGIVLATSGGDGGGSGTTTAPTTTPTPSTSAPSTSAPASTSASSTQQDTSAPPSDTRAPSTDTSSAPSTEDTTSAPSSRPPTSSRSRTSSSASSSSASTSSSSTANAEPPGAATSSTSTTSGAGAG